MAVLKQKPLKGISASFHAHSLKIPKKYWEKKASKEKKGPVRCLCLYSLELKPWKCLTLWIVQGGKNQLYKNCYSCKNQH